MLFYGDPSDKFGVGGILNTFGVGVGGGRRFCTPVLKYIYIYIPVIYSDVSILSQASDEKKNQNWEYISNEYAGISTRTRVSVNKLGR